MAAANPIYGNFDPSMDLARNIGLPDSLLSRFDLIFVVRDQTTEEIDRKIADQVLRWAPALDICHARQCAVRYDDSRKRGVEQIHSSRSLENLRFTIKPRLCHMIYNIYICVYIYI